MNIKFKSLFVFLLYSHCLVSCVLSEFNCTNYIKKIENLIDEYKINSKTITVDCQLNIQHVAEKFTSKINELIQSNFDENYVSVENMKNKLLEIQQGYVDQDQDISEQIKLIRNGKYLDAQKSYMILNEENKNKIITTVYNRNIRNVEKLIDFLDTFDDFNQTLLGYRQIFTEIQKNNHVYNYPTTHIAYRLFYDFNKTLLLQNENFAILNLNLPETIKTFPWNLTVKIQNMKIQQKLNYDFSIDNLTNRRSMYISGEDSTTWFIEPVKNQKYSLIKSARNNEYLYADCNKFSFNNTYRRVFTWMDKNTTKDGGHWQIELTEKNSFKIKNIKWNEYLYVNKNINFININGYILKYPVFTLKSYECDLGCNWNIEQGYTNYYK